MRRLFSFIFQLVAALVLVFLCTAAWIVFDGLHDKGDKADVALVLHGDGPVLARVVELYKNGDFPVVVVSGSSVDIPTTIEAGQISSTADSTDNEADDMAKALQGLGIPEGAIIEAHGETTQARAANIAEIMKERGFQSVMIVADYFDITRAKFVLNHEGIMDIEKAHVGKLQKEDALKIGRETAALYTYVGKVYLLPAAEKAKQEAQVGLEKAKVEADQAKTKVDKSLDTMPK